MKILFIHQNFPGQFKHLAPLLATQGHHCVALTLRVKEQTKWNGVHVVPYALPARKGQATHPWVTDFDTKVTRAQACYTAARTLREKGYAPDLIVAHHGWGESLFLKDVWPEAKLALYCELYHLAEYPHLNYDPGFPRSDTEMQSLRIRLKNLNNRMHFDIADAGISPTQFQANTFPEPFRRKITVAHDGIDTDAIRPDPDARLTIKDTCDLTRNDEVITFVNRNLEPYRGYHNFMRALPALLQARPNARVLIVGGDSVSYGSAPPKGKTWKQIYIDEVRGQIPDADWARVHFLGRIPYDQFTALLQVSRVHVYLTYPFVVSWSLMEAMACEAAIVASDCEPVREVIRDGETGRIVDFFDGEALVAEICALLEDPDARARLGKAARAHIVATYDLKSIALPAQVDWLNRVMTDAASKPASEP